MYICRFLSTVEEVVGQSRKSVKNYLRVKSIMKEETREDERDSPVTQQAILLAILKEEIKSTLDIFKRECGEESAEYNRLNEAMSLLS